MRAWHLQKCWRQTSEGAKVEIKELMTGNSHIDSSQCNTVMIVYIYPIQQKISSKQEAKMHIKETHALVGNRIKVWVDTILHKSIQ